MKLKRNVTSKMNRSNRIGALVFMLTVCLNSYSSAQDYGNATIDIVSVAGCNCYSFSVNDPFDDFYPSDPNDPNGYGYFWDWGDGTYDHAVSAKDTHCFDGAMGTNFDIIVHITPRKKEDELPGIITTSAALELSGFDPLCSVSHEHPEFGMDMIREPKPDQDFFLILNATCILSSSYKLVFDDSYYTFNSVTSIPGNSTILTSGNKIEFNQDGGQYGYYLLSFSVTDFDTTALPAAFTFTVKKCPPENTLSIPIIPGPYDPNCLTPDLGKDLTNCAIGGQWITYHLQFQNEGNGRSDSVKVLVQLDEKLDKNTFEIIRVQNYQSTNWVYDTPLSSQPSNRGRSYSGMDVRPPEVRSNLEGDNLKGFTCWGMVLIPQKNNYANSIGYVDFKVRVKPGVVLEPGEELVSTADIYFDTEDPIMTNLAITSCVRNPAPTCCCCCYSPCSQSISIGNCKRAFYWVIGGWCAIGLIVIILLILIWLKIK